VEADGTVGPGRRLRRSFLRLLAAAAGVAVVAAAAGYLFARSDPQRAAATLVSDHVTEEPLQAAGRAPAVTDDLAPTSGDHDGRHHCGVRDAPLSPDDQLASLASGRVLVQYRAGDLSDADVAVLRDLAGERSAELLLAPNPGLPAPVVATAWRHRMQLEGPQRELLSAFVTAFAGSGPEPRPCADRP
jgi:hypothetical protein